jgi:hypothetical protein
MACRIIELTVLCEEQQSVKFMQKTEYALIRSKSSNFFALVRSVPACCELEAAAR